MKIFNKVTSDRWRVTRTGKAENHVTRHTSHITRRAFTMIEIALCLAVIGIALVAIIGVLPWGMSAQRDNRERTIINQDATVFMQAIRDGSQGGNDLLNYVYAVTNFTGYGTNTFTGDAEIIGLLSTPTTPGFANHAYVRSISGSAVEKPPQNNPLLMGTGDSFSYVLACENVPIQINPNSLGTPYASQLINNLHELRLTFFWPILPGGGLPARPSQQTFRTLVAGQIQTNIVSGQTFYYFQPQSFTNAP